MIINTDNFENFRREALEGKKNREKVVVVARDNEFNRKILEYGRFDVLLGVESFNESSRRDKLRNLDSGLNHVVAKIVASKGIAIGIDLVSLKNLGKREKGVRLARIRRNIEFCRRAGARIKLFGIEDKNIGMAFMISLGASTKQAMTSV